MVIEVRIYKVRSGQRDRFLQFFEEKAAPAQRDSGIQLFGPFVDISNDDVVICLRGFTSLAERDRIRAAFYGGFEWKERLRAEAMNLVESYEVRTAETLSRLFSFAPGFGSDCSTSG